MDHNSSEADRPIEGPAHPSAPGRDRALLSLSQVVFGVHDLDAASAQLEAKGFHVLDGGVHPGVGTANRIVPLGSEYLELLAVVDQGVARANAYGRALLAATADGDRIVRWSLRTDAIEAVAERLHLEVERRSRARPDGRLLTWRAAGLGLSLGDGTLPFFMHWDRSEDYPGLLPARHPNGARKVAWLGVNPSDSTQFAEWTTGADVAIRNRPCEGPGLWGVAVETDGDDVVLVP